MSLYAALKDKLDGYIATLASAEANHCLQHYPGIATIAEGASIADHPIAAAAKAFQTDSDVSVALGTLQEWRARIDEECDRFATALAAGNPITLQEQQLDDIRAALSSFCSQAPYLSRLGKTDRRDAIITQQRPVSRALWIPGT